jgi:hypothetical protein
MDFLNSRAADIRIPWNVKIRWKKKAAVIVLLSAVILSAVLAVHSLIRCERMDLGSGGTYGIVSLPGVQYLFHSTGNRFPELSRIDPADGAALRFAELSFSGKKYAVLICSKKEQIYDRGRSVAAYLNDDGRTVISSFIADKDGDGNDEIFLLLGKEERPYGERLIVLNFDGSEAKKTYDASFEKLNPWKVQVCDVDGDGKMEVSLGVYTVAKYHPVYAKRPFLYEFYNNKLYPKWLGSRLSRPFDDFIFCDMDGDRMDELISVETTRDGKKELNAYKWTGFGFESIGVSQAYDTIEKIEKEGRSVTAVCGSHAAARRKTFTYKNGKLETEDDL